MDEEQVINDLIQRAAVSNIEHQRREIDYGDDVTVHNYLIFPSGKFPRRISISSPEKAELLLSINFEKFSFLESYDAICDMDAGVIEAKITSRGPMGASGVERILTYPSHFAGEDDIDEERDQTFRVSASSKNGVRFEISPCSKDLHILTSRGYARLADTSSQNSLSLKIYLGSKQSYESAVIALETISNALFFQIYCERGASLALKKSLQRRRPTRRRSRPADDNSSLQFPEFEYDSAPISLFWYAKSARGLPLLQFLAYYQVVEYYFPNFAMLESVRSARKLLKHPSFRIDRESDLTRLVSSIAGTGRAGSSEREQMKVTVAEVLSRDEVDQYFSENSDVAEIVSKKQKGITDKTVNVSRGGHDHRPDIAELLYDIRCRIVHTKNDSGTSRSEMLLPFSTAEEELWAYIDLMELVARHALIRSSAGMRIF